jgi:tetratricopeptide (TPR) repeat protein
MLVLEELERRKDIYTYDAAAWALHTAGRTEEAAPLMQQALRLGTEDARMLFHAGIISLELGDSASALRYLERALELNPTFSLTQAEVARGVLAMMK